jgi:hypothetical protein
MKIRFWMVPLMALGILLGSTGFAFLYTKFFDFIYTWGAKNHVPTFYMASIMMVPIVLLLSIWIWLKNRKK